MQVSFVIPTRNQSRFIRRCIDSCLRQQIPDSEIIVIDGLSTDGTQEILRSYGDRIWWSSEADSGQSEAVNKGVARAQGEIVAWLNSDDFYAADHSVKTVVEAFDSDRNVDIVYGRGVIVNADGQPIRPHRTYPWRSLNDVLIAPTGLAMQPAIFFRRNLFQEVGGLRRDLHYAMDYDLWLRVFPRARGVRYLALPLACATFHEDAKSIAGIWKQIREMRELKRVHRAGFALSPLERLRMLAGIASLYAYGWAVELGLRRVT